MNQRIKDYVNQCIDYLKSIETSKVYEAGSLEVFEAVRAAIENGSANELEQVTAWYEVVDCNEPLPVFPIRYQVNPEHEHNEIVTIPEREPFVRAYK